MLHARINTMEVNDVEVSTDIPAPGSSSIISPELLCRQTIIPEVDQ
jgi:hypothetical protein